MATGIRADIRGDARHRGPDRPPLDLLDLAIRFSSRWIPLLAIGWFAAACGGPGEATAADCTRVAAPGGSDRASGTEAAPFRTAQRLAASLGPGQMGCLRAGTYDQRGAGGYVLKVVHGGRVGQPVTIRSFPGERARLEGVVYVPRDSPNVVLSNLDIDGRASWATASTPSVHIMAAGVVFEDNTLTNRRLKSCMLLGSNRGWGKAVDVVIRRNAFRDCGDPAHDMLDHAIYAENVRGGEISRNVFTGTSAWAVHLYPNSQGVRVSENVMTGNGGGVIFAGEGELASSGNVVERNIITGTTRDHGVASYWGDRVGAGNVASANCLSGTRKDAVARPLGFASRGNVEADAPLVVTAGTAAVRLGEGSSCAGVVGSWAAGPDVAPGTKTVPVLKRAATTPPVSRRCRRVTASGRRVLPVRYRRCLRARRDS